MVRLVVWVAALVAAATWSWSGAGWASTPEGQAMAVVRVVAASLATWLLLATVLAAVGRLLRIRWLGWLAPAVVRRLVAGALAGGLLVAPGVAGATAGGAPPPGVEVPVLERVDDETAAPATVPPTAVAPSTPTPPPPPVDGSRTHVVAAGEHLWAVAEMQVAARLGRPPTDAEIVPYWRELIEANRRVVGRNPDLVRPGDRLDLPS